MSDAQSNFTPSVASLPTTVLRSYTVKSIPTDVMIQLFADRISIIVTQMNGRVGTLLSVSVEDSVIDMSRTYNISTLLGRRDDAMVDVLARQVAEQIAKGIACGELKTKIPALVTIQSFTRMLLAKRKAVTLTKRKATNCLNGERDTHSLVSSDDLLHDLNQPVAKGQTVFDNLNVNYIGASEDPRKNDDDITNEG